MTLTGLVFLLDGGNNLLYDGGWSAQPAWLIEAIELYRLERARLQKEKRDD